MGTMEHASEGGGPWARGPRGLAGASSSCGRAEHPWVRWLASDSDGGIRRPRGLPRSVQLPGPDPLGAPGNRRCPEHWPSRPREPIPQDIRPFLSGPECPPTGQPAFSGATLLLEATRKVATRTLSALLQPAACPLRPARSRKDARGSCAVSAHWSPSCMRSQRHQPVGVHQPFFLTRMARWSPGIRSSVVTVPRRRTSLTSGLATRRPWPSKTYTSAELSSPQP